MRRDALAWLKMSGTSTAPSLVQSPLSPGPLEPHPSTRALVTEREIFPLLLTVQLMLSPLCSSVCCAPPVRAQRVPVVSPDLRSNLPIVPYR